MYIKQQNKEKGIEENKKFEKVLSSPSVAVNKDSSEKVMETLPNKPNNIVINPVNNGGKLIRPTFIINDNNQLELSLDNRFKNIQVFNSNKIEDIAEDVVSGNNVKNVVNVKDVKVKATNNNISDSKTNLKNDINNDAIVGKIDNVNNIDVLPTKDIPNIDKTEAHARVSIKFYGFLFVFSFIMFLFFVVAYGNYSKFHIVKTRNFKSLLNYHD